MKCVLCLSEYEGHMAICQPCYVTKVLPLKTTRLKRYFPYSGDLI
jgi:hypothetical protein